MTGTAAAAAAAASERCSQSPAELRLARAGAGPSLRHAHELQSDAAVAHNADAPAAAQLASKVLPRHTGGQQATHASAHPPVTNTAGQSQHAPPHLYGLCVTQRDDALVLEALEHLCGSRAQHTVQDRRVGTALRCSLQQHSRAVQS